MTLEDTSPAVEVSESVAEPDRREPEFRKRCGTCGGSFPFSAFNRRTRTDPRPRAHCKGCQSLLTRAYNRREALPKDPKALRLQKIRAGAKKLKKRKPLRVPSAPVPEREVRRFSVAHHRTSTPRYAEHELPSLLGGFEWGGESLV